MVLVFIIPQTGQVEHKESPVPILPEVSSLLQISLLQYPLDHQLVEFRDQFASEVHGEVEVGETLHHHREKFREIDSIGPLGLVLQPWTPRVHGDTDHLH